MSTQTSRYKEYWWVALLIGALLLCFCCLATISGAIFFSTQAMSAPTPKPTPAAPATAAPTPAAPAFQPPTPDPTDCRVIHDYQLRGLTEVATSSGNWLHVEYWVGGDAPEYETILPGGRYLLQVNFAGGHVWEYADGCTFEQVKAEVDSHIQRRLDQKANNGGYVEWQATGFFNPVR